jgi:hypothetical protein
MQALEQLWDEFCHGDAAQSDAFGLCDGYEHAHAAFHQFDLEEGLCYAKHWTFDHANDLASTL